MTTKRKPKPEYKCHRCSRLFTTAQGLSIHKTRASHWGDPTPPTPIMEHVNFIDLVRNSQWGRDYPKDKKKSPADNDIIMGLLALIVEKLESIRIELEKPRTLK